MSYVEGPVREFLDQQALRGLLKQVHHHDPDAFPHMVELPFARERLAAVVAYVEARLAARATEPVTTAVVLEASQSPSPAVRALVPGLVAVQATSS